MEKESLRGFQYQASLPYRTETSDEALDELNKIVARIEHLRDTDQFQHYTFGTAYAYDAALATRELLSWQSKKLEFPLETRLHLTEIYAQAYFDAVEPSLIVRYGSVCLSLWKSTEARLELRKLRGVIDWGQMARAVKNVLLFQSTKNSGLGTRIDGLGQGYGNDDATGSFGNVGAGASRPSNQVGVALSLARLFRCTAVMDDHSLPVLMDEILSFLGPHGHEPSQQVVIDAFVALIPYNDPRALSVFIPVLFDLWNKVTLSVASLHILPALAEFAEQTLRNGTTFPLTTEQLDICFQSVLHSLQIPLMSAQKSKVGGSSGSQSRSSSHGHKSSRHGHSTVNTRPFGSHAGAFARLVVWSLTPQDSRALDLLDSLVNAVLSFCHPSNIGPWTALIFTSLVEIATAYTQRYNMEEELDVPENLRLTSSQTKKLAETLKKPVFMGIHNQAPYVLATALETLRYIALLSPETVITSLLGEIYPTLQHGLHQPHRLVTSLACLARVAVPLVSKPQYKMHLTTLLELSLPNLDANESKRCMLTLALFQSVASVSQFVDESDDVSVALAGQCLPECVHALTLEGRELPAEISDDENIAIQISKGTTAAYPEILSLYMRRIFDLLETTSENRLGSAASASVLRVLLACSPQIYDRLLEVTLEQVLNPHQQSHDAFAQVCGAFVRANCAKSFGKFWSLISTNIREEILENQAGAARIATPKDNALLRYLSVLNMSLLAANSDALLAVSYELRDLLHLIREKTSVSVVYTVANTLHHTISALVGYSVILPDPSGTSVTPEGYNAIASVPYLDMKWNVPTEKSRELAVDLFEEHIGISEANIAKSIDGASTNVNDEDAVSSALIFVRTALGSISAICESNERVIECRRKIFRMISAIYSKLGKDNVSGLKEVLFVAKVWLCDVGYERTARLDSHQVTLYQYEKRTFHVAGTKKRALPPAVLARRAQLYHHQRMALRTRNRDLDQESEELIFNVVIDACFSAYPAVKRNAFSALYSPLKIFANRGLYARVYERVISKIGEFVDCNEYERAEGGLSLLKYRSFGLQTVGQFPEFITQFVKTISLAASADHRQLGTLAAYAFFMLAPDALRVGLNYRNAEEQFIVQIRELVDYLTSEPLSSLHWREALFRASALLAISYSPGFPINSKVLQLFLEGSLVHHPDVRTTSVLGALNLMQKFFRLGFVGYDFQNYKCDGGVELPRQAVLSSDSSLLQCDWSLFFNPYALSVAKAWKTQPRAGPKLMKTGSQGWAYLPKSGKTWRVPSQDSTISPELHAEDDEKLRQVMGSVNTSKFWKELIALQKVEPRAEDDRMTRHISLLLRNLICLAGMGYCGPGESLATLLGCVKLDESESLTDKNSHRVLSELLAGLMLATPVLNKESYELVSDYMRDIMQAALGSISQETLGYWLSSLSYALSNVDHRRLLPIIELMEAEAKPNTSHDGGGLKLSLRTDLYAEVLSIVQWHRPRLHEVIANWPEWNHSLQTTRESSANIVSIAATTARGLEKQDISEINNVFDLEMPKVELSLLDLTLRMLQLLGGDACLPILVEKAFPLLLRYSAVRDDPEIVVLVTKVFAELASTAFSTASLETVSRTVLDSTMSAQWHQRMRMLLCMQSFFFNHLLILDRKTRLELAAVVTDALQDPQAEVRDLAADTLSGIVRCSPADEQHHYVQQLKAKFKKSIGRNTELVERHASVLGLGALIGAFPYTSPPPRWIPELLAVLAVKSAGDSGIVGKSTKQILSDFKKTRQDTWHIDQAVFSQEQLDDLDGVLWKNYFA